MRQIPFDRLPPIPLIALRTMRRETLSFEPGRGWLPGYPCPAGDRGMIPFNTATIRWLGEAGLATIREDDALITDEGWAVLDAIDGIARAA